MRDRETSRRQRAVDRWTDVVGGLAFLAGAACTVVVVIAALHWLFSGPSYRYEVSVTSPGVTCDRDAVLYLSEETGQPLSCASQWTGKRHDTGTDFTDDETLQIVNLSTTLAADGRLDGGDKKKIDDLAAQIGKAHTGDHSFPGWGVVALKGLGICIGVVVLNTVAAAAFGPPQRPSRPDRIDSPPRSSSRGYWR